jgi:nicotinamide-nucleotide amidase
MPEINRRQAMVPRGAVVLPNTRGSAPGLWIEDDDRVVLLLPGPPRELRPMLDAVVTGRLAGRGPGRVLVRRVIRVAGRIESHVDEAMQPLYREWERSQPPVAATILAAFGNIELHLSTRAPTREAADAALATAVREAVAVLGEDAYSTDGRPMEAIVGDLLASRGLRIAVAESCTGGLLASRLTDVPGSSRYIDLAVVAYANAVKTEIVGVAGALIEAHGAVSEPVAVAMAEGIRQRGRAEIGVGVTGIAGPTGGSPEKPVGTVAIAVVTPTDRRVRTFAFFGERDQVKAQAAFSAMDMVRRLLIGEGEQGGE